MENPLTVSELTKEIRYIVESNFQFVYVTAEITNFKHHLASGHYYFTLKDEKAQINANMWSSRTQNLIFKPENGMKVIVKGRVTVYESRGSYQIDVFEMLPSGKGDLHAEFEKLKQKLYNEGLFDEIHKKPIPEFPERVFVITSESGAALQDFIKVTKKRYPLVLLYLLHANMQGEGSAESICKAIRFSNKSKIKPDIIVITRGGGSMEDLWSFNEEKVVREIFNSEIPIITAIGHEVDFTLSDFAADMRAATPSAAAENIFPDKSELLNRLEESYSDLKETVLSKITNLRIRLENISGNYYFRKPMDYINENKIRLDDLNKRLADSAKKKIEFMRNSLLTYEKLLVSLSPDQILKRGYTIILKDDKIIPRSKSIEKDSGVKIKFYDGEREATINN